MFGKEAKYCSPGCNPSNTLQRAFREKFASTGANFNNAQHRKILRDPVGYLLIHAKSNAKQSGVEFDLTREDIKIPARCPVLGRFLKFHFAPKGGRRGPSWDSISLDRTVCYPHADQHTLVAIYWALDASGVFWLDGTGYGSGMHRVERGDLLHRLEQDGMYDEANTLRKLVGLKPRMPPWMYMALIHGWTPPPDFDRGAYV